MLINFVKWLCDKLWFFFSFHLSHFIWWVFSVKLWKVSINSDIWNSNLLFLSLLRSSFKNASDSFLNLYPTGDLLSFGTIQKPTQPIFEGENASSKRVSKWRIIISLKVLALKKDDILSFIIIIRVRAFFFFFFNLYLLLSDPFSGSLF